MSFAPSSKPRPTRSHKLKRQTEPTATTLSSLPTTSAPCGARPRRCQGHFARTGTSPKRKVIEFRDFDGDVEEGGTVSITDVFVEGEKIDVTGTSKGKGFQGVVKRHGFAGVGGQTHGQHNRQRAPGSIGMASTPSRVFKGMKMGGRTGNDRVTVKNLVVARILADSNLILVKGAIPGAKGGYVELHKQAPRG